MRNKLDRQNTTAGVTDDRIRHFLESVIRFFDGDKTFYNTADFAWIKNVEAAFPMIRAELLDVLKNDNVPAWDSISDDPNVRIGEQWKTFVFCAYRRYVRENCERCPETSKALQQIPGLVTAWFSILEPQTSLPEHEGPYNGVLRYHLGLVIPSNDAEHCGIRVGKDTRTWKEGESLLFDDTHPHEAWNLTDSKRVVLFVDVERPLPFPLSLVNKLAIRYAGSSTFIQDLIHNIRKKHEAAAAK